MPWFPDFVGAVELASRHTRAARQPDPVGRKEPHVMDLNLEVVVVPDRIPGLV
jgi:hypothetical protein